MKPTPILPMLARWCRWPLVAGGVAAALLQGAPAPHGRLQVTANHRYLEYADGTPFFYLGDTAWTLLSRLSRADADRYLVNRAAKGFTVIQAVVLAPEEGLTVPNANGDLPLVDRDPGRPNEAYFRHVDQIVSRAAELGLVMGLLPAWGEYWKQGGAPERSIFDPEKAKSFGRFLGQRYRGQPVIWILGGDQDIGSPADRAVVDGFAAGVQEGDGGAHLITYHPRGPGFSSDSLGDARWLDFNMVQSSHAGHDHDNGLFARHDYGLTPVRPTLDGEPRYEGIPVGFYFTDVSRLDRFDDYDARQAAYWSLLCGACGHTYGNNNVWQFWQAGRRPAIGANVPWPEALDAPGAFQMGLVRRLFESRPFTKLAPNDAMLLEAPRAGGATVRAACASDGSFAFVYSPRGEPFTVDKNVITGRRIREIWYDPRYGCSYLIHTTDTHGYQTYTPPTSGRGQDWILILEDAARNFPLPGAGKP